MLGFFFAIIIIIAVMAFAINYMNNKNNSGIDILLDELQSSKNFKENAVNHITNALKELDYLGKKYKYKNSRNNSTCYRSKGKMVLGCSCHPSCKTCGYSDNPIGINQCLKCKNGTDVNVLYNNGAGWCGSFDEAGNIEDSDADVTEDDSTSSDASDNDISDNVIGYEGESCATIFRRTCGSAADWRECLERNKYGLLTKGCSIDLEASKRFYLSLKPDSNFLYKGEELSSQNSKYTLIINNNGQVVFKGEGNTKTLWSPTVYINGPYKLKFNKQNVLSVVNKSGESIKDINGGGGGKIGVNSKVLIDDTGILRIVDNVNREIYRVNVKDTTSETTSSGNEGKETEGEENAASGTVSDCKKSRAELGNKSCCDIYGNTDSDIASKYATYCSTYDCGNNKCS